MNRIIRLITFGLAPLLATLPCAAAPLTIMLNPAGHATQPGRTLHKTLERAETLKFAQALQTALELNPAMRVLLTRAPGEEIVPLQNASFANRSSADLYLSIHFYKEGDEKPGLNLYHLVNDTLLDPTRSLLAQDFIPINQAHCLSLKKTISLGNAMLKQLGKAVGKRFAVAPKSIGLPLHELAGITCPAFCMEIGLNKDNDWQEITDALAAALISALTL